MYDTQWNIIQPQGKEILLYHRSSKPESCLRVPDAQRKPPGRLADADMRLLLTLQGSTPTAARWCERGRTPSILRLVIRGPRQRQPGSRLHKPMYGPELHCLHVYMQKERSRISHRTGSCSQKETRRVLQSIPQTICILSGPEPSGQPSSWIVGEPCNDPTHIHTLFSCIMFFFNFSFFCTYISTEI